VDICLELAINWITVHREQMPRLSMIEVARRFGLGLREMKALKSKYKFKTKADMRINGGIDLAGVEGIAGGGDVSGSEVIAGIRWEIVDENIRR